MSALKPSDSLAQEHGLPRGKHIAGHRIVVKGIYLSSDIDPHNGHFEKKEIPYEESFELAPHEHRVHGQGALGHLLSDKILTERLSEKDKNFRAIKTHTIIKHENILVDAPKPDAPKSE